MQSLPGSKERFRLRRARIDAEELREVFKRREIGVPSFLIGGLLIPVIVSGGRLASGIAFQTWWAALVTVLIGVGIPLRLSWVILRGAAMASRRIRLSVREPIEVVWTAVGHCGDPPRPDVRKFAIIAISLTFAAWLIIPVAIAWWLAT